MVRAGRAHEALEALEQGRSLLLSEALARDRADLAALSAQRPGLAEAYRTAVGELDAVLRCTTADPEANRRARARIDDVAARIRRVPGHESFLIAPTLADVSAAAQRAVPNGVLVYLAPAQHGGTAVLVGGHVQQERPEEQKRSEELAQQGDEQQEDEGDREVEQSAVRVVDLPACTLQACRDRLTALLAARSQVGTGAFAGTLDAVSHWLYTAVLAPVLAATDAPRLVLVPTGLLSLLPLHAAWRPGADGTQRRYILDEVVLSYAPSARALLACAHTAAATRLQRAVIVADPQPTQLPAIGFATAEASWASAGLETLQLSGAAATRAAVLQHAPGADLLHFACHGSSRPEHPLQGGLMLAANEQLTLADTLGARLSGSQHEGTRLAVLSACDTDQPGLDLPDEVVSLPTGLLQAGAAGVLATQWAVRSLPAALLVAAFHAHWRLRNYSPPQALTLSQRWLRSTTNADKVGDLRAWSSAFGPEGAVERRELVRTLQLRDPEAHDFTDATSWAAASFHGL
nr:CHAT domain-containing protein [Kineococcus vitellinus]